MTTQPGISHVDETSDELDLTPISHLDGRKWKVKGENVQYMNVQLKYLCPANPYQWKPFNQHYSRLSLFRLSEVRPPRYTGHLAWHGMLAICLLHKNSAFEHHNNYYCVTGFVSINREIQITVPKVSFSTTNHVFSRTWKKVSLLCWYQMENHLAKNWNGAHIQDNC